MEKAVLLEGVDKKLGGRNVLHNVSFVVERGDVFGFLGPNGAGKTTTIRIILGLLPPSSGRVRVLGQDITWCRATRKVGFVLEADGLYENATAFSNLNYYAQIYGVTKPQASIARVLKMVDLSSRAKDKVGTFSKGMRQRLALGRSLLHDPELLVLDEPTSGVDPTGQMEIRRLILNEVRDRGMTVFLSSHNLDEVQRICNRIGVIDKGEIRLYGDRETLQRQGGKGRITIESVQAVPATVIEALEKLPELVVEHQTDRMLVLSLLSGTSVSDIVAFLTAHGVRIEEVRHSQASLEDIYTSILKEAAR